MHIPLIILSAKTSDEERIEGLESGADVYISKPFSLSLLQATVTRLLENRNVLREYYNSAASAYIYSSGELISKECRGFADEVTQMIDEHLADSDLTPEALAELMSMSPRNLYRKFSDANLPTPKDYIKSYRIHVAARLLTTTGITIQEIIYKTGFNTRSQFYTEFRKQFGMTPKEYREQQQTI
jgi:AraC-like DNA-binding protein